MTYAITRPVNTMTLSSPTYQPLQTYLPPHAREQVVQRAETRSEVAERLTMRILDRLACLANEEMERRDDAIGLIEEILELPHRNSREIISSPRAYRRSVSVSTGPALQESSLIGVIQGVMLSLGTIFLGWQSYQPGQDARSLNEVEESLNTDFLVWQLSLSEWYAEHYNRRIQTAFRQAKKLIEEKRSLATHNYYLRITLIASAIFTSFNFAFNAHPIYVATGAVTCTITALFMISKYGKSSFDQSKMITDLKSTVERAKNEADLFLLISNDH